MPAVPALALSIERTSGGRLPALWFVFCLLVAGLSSACGAKSEDPNDLPGPVVDPGPPPLGDGLPLPFVVDDHFHPSGCYAAEGCPVTIDTGCSERAEGAQGQCYVFRFVEGQAFAGVFFQNVDEVGAGNWGQAPGTTIVPGASAVTFYAAASPAGQSVTFKVGGISDAELSYKDSLNIEFVATLGSELEHFSIPLDGANYEQVLSAFSWHVVRLDGQAGPIDLILDDVRWE